MFDIFGTKREMETLRYEKLDLLRCKLALMEAIESMYYDDTITKSQFVELCNRYFDKLEQLRKEGA